MTRTRLSTDARRAQLIDSGLQLFGSRPYDEISMDDVADDAGVSHGLVYRYFADKRDLYLAVLQSVAEAMIAATTIDPERSPAERLLSGLDAYLRYAEQYPAGYTALIAGGNGNDEAVRDLCEQARWRGLGEIVATLGIDEPSAELKVVLRGWQGFQEGATIEWLKRRDLDRDRLLALIAGSLAASLSLAGLDVAAVAAG